MTSADVEPTPADWDAAEGCVERACQGNTWTEVIARALADQRAEIHARYAGIADGLVEDNPRRQWIADAIKTLGQGPLK